MRVRANLAFAGVLAVAAACSGDKGDPGDPGQPGAPGDTGEPGEPGPLSDPPHLLALSPAWGSAATHVTITGDGFSATASENRVTFNGYLATVIAASPTELVVEPSVDTADEVLMVVDVEVSRQVSNGLTFDLVPSWTSRATPQALPTAPTAVVGVGGELFVAAGNMRGPTSGLYEVDADGVVSLLVAAEDVSLPVGGGGSAQLRDGPIALATDGTDVYYVTTLGSVMKYVVADGSVEQVLAPSFGGPGGEPPTRTGVAFDSAGVMYVVDRSLGGTGGIIRVEPDGTTQAMTDPAFGDGAAAEIVGIASDGTDLFISDMVDQVVIKVSNPETSFDVTDNFATGAAEPIGITVLGTEVVVSNSDGTLRSVDKTSGGPLAAFGDAGGYVYRAEGLWTDGTDLYLAQSSSSAIRRIAGGSTDAELVAVGERLEFGSVQVGDTWYFSGVGFGLFGGPMSDAAPDGAILQVNPDGTSQLLAQGRFPTGMLASGAGKLTVSDCFEQRIYTLDLETGARVDRLTAADGLTCPAALFENAAGDLFYTNADIQAPTPSSIGRLTSDGDNQVDYVTGLPPGTVTMAVKGTTAFATWLGGGMENGTDIYTADLSSGGVASVLVPAARAGTVSALGVSPDGALLGYRFGLGDLIKIDPTSGAVEPLANTWLPGAVLPGQEGAVAATFSLAFMDDGTVVVPDGGQGAIIHVAP